jgi:two-component system sensor histidine kinase CpxA
MMKPFSSLLSKILLWFFINLAVVAAVLTVFFAFQSQVDLRAVFGQQASDRLRTAGRLIVRELNQVPQTNWPDVLARHAEIHQVDFALLLKGGFQSLSKDMEIPEAVMQLAKGSFRPKPSANGVPQPPKQYDFKRKKRRFMVRTKNPTRYWTGVRMRIPVSPSRPSVRAVLLAVSDSVTGNGFFFDPLPWIIVATTVMLISVVLWIPFVSHITRSLARMTRATEEIAKGRFDVRINEPRADEIGRLARAINHMTMRLRSFVKGQKSFLGDVAHELSSPIARIRLGLGILEQRIDANHQKQIKDVMEDVTHMSNLVNELLSFSQAELDTAPVMLQRIELLPVIQRVVQRESMPDTEIITNIDPKIQAVADAERLTRALANSIRNAIKYAGNAGPIHISATRKGNTVNIEVRDAGPGVPDDLVDQIFEPFFRPEPSRDPGSGGVGLGLAIVKTCIDSCKGTVSARNLKPQGFAITISLTSAVAME